MLFGYADCEGIKHGPRIESLFMKGKTMFRKLFVCVNP